MADVYGAPAPVVLQHRAAHPRFNRRSKTYLAMIACVLQDTPGKMLTFSQLMEKLEEFVTGDRKCFENNIRVCLSYSKCFVKNPMYPQMPSCKLNYWKLDHSQITVKMVHRHFRKILDQFPELAPKMAKWPLTPQGSPGPITTVPHTPEPADCKAPPTRGSIKFRGPFSIESLLRRDSPSRQGLEKINKLFLPRTGCHVVTRIHVFNTHTSFRSPLCPSLFSGGLCLLLCCQMLGH
uniref:Fork-head domain-containing protein n=1 Tax=Gadus morhua TaxID=8049 RepID=A0A8C4ZPE4_GADMO